MPETCFVFGSNTAGRHGAVVLAYKNGLQIPSTPFHEGPEWLGGVGMLKAHRGAYKTASVLKHLTGIDIMDVPEDEEAAPE